MWPARLLTLPGQNRVACVDRFIQAFGDAGGLLLARGAFLSERFKFRSGSLRLPGHTGLGGLTRVLSRHRSLPTRKYPDPKASGIPAGPSRGLERP
jgi:hypothetical protein